VVQVEKWLEENEVHPPAVSIQALTAKPQLPVQEYCPKLVGAGVIRAGLFYAQMETLPICGFRSLQVKTY
jgi:hypothetical protein